MDQIDTEGLDEQIRCEMCRNPMHTDRGCDGNCKYDETLYERIMQILGERIKPLPSAHPDNQIHLCDSCEYNYPECPCKQNDVIFGNGKGNDNICACNKYKPSAQPEQRWIPCSKTVDIPDHEILACDKYGEEMFGYLVYEDEQWLCESYGGVMCDPIAWREKPEPYREEGDE